MLELLILAQFGINEIWQIFKHDFQVNDVSNE